MGTIPVAQPATKLDKINRSQVQKHVKMIREGLNGRR